MCFIDYEARGVLTGSESHSHGYDNGSAGGWCKRQSDEAAVNISALAIY